MKNFDEKLEELMEQWNTATEGMTDEEIREVLRESQNRPEVPSELVGKVGLKMAEFYKRLQDEGITDVDANAITNMSLDISEDVSNLDERWIDYMEMEYHNGFTDPEEGFIDPSITIQVGPRDIQYTVEGLRIGSGMVMFELPKPWEK
jgi:hypothetical protein